MNMNLKSLFTPEGEMCPEFEWVHQGKGVVSVWWDTATLHFTNGVPIVEGEVSEEQAQDILAAAKNNGYTDGYYFVCGPGIQGNLYNFSELTFIRLGSVKAHFSEIRNRENIRRFLRSQGYRGLVFIDDTQPEGVCYVTAEQLKQVI